MTLACSSAVSVFMYTRLAEKCRSVNVLFLTCLCKSVRIQRVKMLIYPVLLMQATCEWAGNALRVWRGLFDGRHAMGDFAVKRNCLI